MLKVRRNEEDQASRIKQIQLEASQFHMENIKMSLSQKLHFSALPSLEFLVKFFKVVKEKIGDAYYVASTPCIIDSVIFEKELRGKEVSLISESLVRVTRQMPVVDEEDKKEEKSRYEDEEVTMVDEKRLGILTAITFRDLFRKKVKMLYIRKKELFNQSLVYLDYDVVKITNIKNKSILMGCIHEVQKALKKIQVGNLNDDMSSVNNDGSRKLTQEFLHDKAIYLYDKLQKLNLRKTDITAYKDHTQKIKELLALK